MFEGGDVPVDEDEEMKRALETSRRLLDEHDHSLQVGLDVVMVVLVVQNGLNIICLRYLIW